MKTIRSLGSCLTLGVAAAALAADPSGTWKWSTRSPNGSIETCLKLELKDGTLAGAYSNQFGDTAISNATFRGNLVTFDVVRDLGGQKYVVKYRGKLEGDTINGAIEAPGHDGGDAVKLDWNARRMPEVQSQAKPKT